MSEAPKIELVQGEIATVNLKPGDRVVLMYPQMMTMTHREELAAMWKRFAPGVPCLVMDSGARLGVIRAANGDLDANPAA